MTTRGIQVRLLQWRAKWFWDPVKRLRFLQRTVAPDGGLRPGRALAPTLLLLPGLALAGVALAEPDWRRALERTLAEVLRPTPPAPAQVVAVVSAEAKAEAEAEVAPPAGVWPVEARKDFEVYSNGLRVENQFLTPSQPREYFAFVRAGGRAGAGKWRTEPAGIVYHTTESHLAPFREDQNRKLQRASMGMLEYVRGNRSYHFVIDRFGRVFRIVRESDSANHAGHSVWADENWIYLSLNQSFFGVAFEAQSRARDEGIPVSPAQVHAGRILTEMLRARYGIAAANCVAHAQVSVNTGNWRAGYHTDFAANLPFAELGLSDNYERPLPSLTLFGFDYDGSLAEAGGAPLRKGLQLAEDEVRDEAAAHGVSVARYRKGLHNRYRDATAALSATGVAGENN